MTPVELFLQSWYGCCVRLILPWKVLGDIYRVTAGQCVEDVQVMLALPVVGTPSRGAVPACFLLS